MLRANVGDKYVLEEMLKTGATLGGEQSGHILFRDGDATTGDGLLTALRLMEIMARSRKEPGGARGGYEGISRRLFRTCACARRFRLRRFRQMQAAITAAEKELDGNGRVVVRYSGTEALARVMVEAETGEKVIRLGSSISSAIKAELGL